MEENKKEDLDMSKKPKTEVAIFGFGALLNHEKKIAEFLDRQNFLLSKTEQKIGGQTILLSDIVQRLDKQNLLIEALLNEMKRR